MKLYPFHQGKVDSLFVVVGGNHICYRCVFGGYYNCHSRDYWIGLLCLCNYFVVYFVDTELRSIG